MHEEETPLYVWKPVIRFLSWYAFHVFLAEQISWLVLILNTNTVSVLLFKRCSFCALRTLKAKWLFHHVFSVSTRNRYPPSNSLGLKSVFGEKLRFCGRLMTTVGLDAEIKLRFSNSSVHAFYLLPASLSFTHFLELTCKGSSRVHAQRAYSILAPNKKQAIFQLCNFSVFKARKRSRNSVSGNLFELIKFCLSRQTCEWRMKNYRQKWRGGNQTIKSKLGW